MYIGHKREDGKVQLLKDHLTGVMNLAEKYAQSFGAGDHARRVGILHDAGKYSRAGQRRMADPENTRKVDHSTAGAQIAMKECRRDVWLHSQLSVIMGECQTVAESFQLKVTVP